MMRIFESLLEESNKKKFIKSWLSDDVEKVEEYDEMYEKYKQVFDNEVKKRGLNWQTSMNLEIFEEILGGVKDRKTKTELKKQNKLSGKSDFLSYVLANPDCDLTYLGTLCSWDYFKIETWPGAMLADSPKASLKGDTGAKWCIGWKDPEKQKFDEYTRQGLDFILIVKSDNSNKDEEEKYCIQIVRETGLVYCIWDPVDNDIQSKRKIFEILYKQEIESMSERLYKRVPGILKGIDIITKEYIQPENKIVSLDEENLQREVKSNSRSNEVRLYKSGTDQLIDSNDVTTIDFIELKPLPKSFFSLLKFTNVEKVVLPKGVRVIEAEYFGGFTGLKHIEIPNSVEEIRRSAFCGCRNLESIKLPANLRKIGEYTFAFCESLKHLEIPDSVETISNEAFMCCKNLKHIEIPDSVEEIGDRAFADCENLESVKLPANLKKIDEFTFTDCENLKYIEIPDTVEEIGWRCFASCKSLKHIEIPDSVKEIGDSAFYKSGITDQNLIDKIESINKKAFKEY